MEGYVSPFAALAFFGIGVQPVGSAARRRKRKRPILGKLESNDGVDVTRNFYFGAGTDQRRQSRLCQGNSHLFAATADGHGAAARSVVVIGIERYRYGRYTSVGHTHAGHSPANIRNHGRYLTGSFH